MWCAGDAAKTYGEIAARVRALCATLRRDGLRPEERVLFVLPDGFEFVEAWFAALRAGGVFAMVNPLLKEKDYRYYLEYTKAAAVFVHSSVAQEFAPALAGSRHCRVAYVVGGELEGAVPFEEAVARVRRAPSSSTSSPPAPTTSLAGSSPPAPPASPRPASTSSATSPTPPRPSRSRSLATVRTTSASRSPSSSSDTRRGRT